MVVVDNPWWAIYSQQCPQCKQQQARHDLPDSFYACLSVLLPGWLADYLAGWLADYLAGWLTTWLADYLAGYLADWLPACLPVYLFVFH